MNPCVKSLGGEGGTGLDISGGFFVGKGRGGKPVHVSHVSAHYTDTETNQNPTKKQFTKRHELL